MPSENPLESVWQAYQVTKDCFRIAQRTVSKDLVPLLNRTQFIGVSRPEAEGRIEKSRAESEDFAVVALWIAFERYLVQYVQGKGKKLLEESPREFARVLHEKVDHEIEYWKVDDVLDIFKSIVDPDLLGHAKNIKKYRDWIAHKNPKQGSPPKTEPKATYMALSRIIDEIHKVEGVTKSSPNSPLQRIVDES